VLLTIFLTDHRVRAGWRIAMYIAMMVFLIVGIKFTLSNVLAAAQGSSPTARGLFVSESLSFLIVFLPACVMARFERRPLGDYGLPLRSAFGKRFWQGCALGLVEIAVLIGCIAAFHGYSFGGLNLYGPAIWKWALFWLAFFVVVGLAEEFMFRGYLQFTLADGIGFWPAAWILSIGFGAVHLRNEGEGYVGAAGVVTIALPKNIYTTAELNPSSGQGIRATLGNTSDQPFYSMLGDAFNGAIDQNPLFVANGSDASLEREQGSDWVAVSGVQMIEGVKVVSIQPGKSYELIAHATSATAGRYRIVVNYRNSAKAEPTRRVVSAIFEVR